jgi:hypothetical protein
MARRYGKGPQVFSESPIADAALQRIRQSSGEFDDLFRRLQGGNLTVTQNGSHAYVIARPVTGSGSVK